MRDTGRDVARRLAALWNTPLPADAFTAFCVWLFATAFGLSYQHQLLGALLPFAFAIPLIWRRTRPDAAALGIIPAHLIQLATTPWPHTGNIGVPMMLYAVAAYGREAWTKRWLIAGLVASLVAAGAWSFQSEAEPARRVFAFVVIAGGCGSVVVAAWFMGSLKRSRLAKIQAQQDRLEALQRERVQAVRLASTEERQRIAREMHDIIAHSLSIIVVQADGATYVATEAPGSPEDRLARAAQALATIQITARTALAETRRLVGVLHSEEDAQAAELAPAASLGDIEGLVENLRSAGVEASYAVGGDPESHAPLDAGAQLTAYRIVQESLTNVLKHAGPDAAVAVTVVHTPTGVALCVTDDGVGASGSDGQGHGLIGMRERVSALGGHLRVGNRPTGGFAVDAFLPAPTPER